jgi:hypothetical protein
MRGASIALDDELPTPWAHLLGVFIVGSESFLSLADIGLI